MASNGSGISSSLVHAPASPQGPYSYRSGIGMISSAEWFVFFDDFTPFIPATAITNGPVANTPWGWQAAIIDAGATLTVNTTAAVGLTGVLTNASDGASEGVAIYLPKSVQLTAGKKFMLEARVRTLVAAETDVQIGLSDLTGTTNPEDLWTTTSANFATFGTLAGSAITNIFADKSNSGTATQVGTRSLVDATWHILALSYDGVSLRGYVDGKLSALWAGAAATIPTGVALAPFFGARTGATAANTTFIDYFRFAIER